MDRQEQEIIQGLFAKLGEVERQGGPRDPQAEELIRARIASQPGAPYYMAQTIVVQEQALEAAQQRIDQLEREVASRPAGGGFLSSLFGGGGPAPAPTPQRSFGGAGAMGRGMHGSFAQPAAAQPRGGFLAGAAQTAMGVAGGMLLGNMIAGAFSGSGAQASEAPSTADDVDNGGDFGDQEF